MCSGPQFRSRSRCQTEDTYTFLEALQHLDDLAWPFMDYNAKEEMVIDRLLLIMGNHELRMQVAAHGHRQIEDILQIAQSLEAVQEEERFLGNHTCFTNNKHDHSPDTKQLVKDVLVQLGHEHKLGTDKR